MTGNKRISTVLRWIGSGLSLAALVSAAGPADTKLTAFVSDPAGLPIAGAHVELTSPVQRPAVAVTDPRGEALFSGLAAGRYSLRASKRQFAPGFAEVSLDAGAEARIAVQLAIAFSETQVIVVAGAAEQRRDADSTRLTVISRDEISASAIAGVADVAATKPGVAMQQTSPSMGGIAVRGMFGKGVVVYRDGVRLSTSAQRGGVSTFFNLQEPSNLEEAQILRGPDAAQYGSDSLGGTVHFLSRTPRYTQGGSEEHADVRMFYSSAANAFGGNVSFARGTERAGLLVNTAARRINTVRTGGGFDSHAAVTRFLGLPSTVLGTRLPDTGFTQYGGQAHGQFALGNDRQLVLHYERNQQDAANRYDQLSGGDGNLIAALRNLMLDLAYARYVVLPATRFTQIAVTGSYNAQREERVNQGGQGNPLASISNQYERMRVWGLTAHAIKDTGAHSLAFGSELYMERMSAHAATARPSSGAIELARPRVPDGAGYWHGGVYAQDSFAPLAGWPLRVSGAVRWAGARYRSSRGPISNPNSGPLWPFDRYGAGSLSGRASVRYSPRDQFHVSLQYARGFRAPSMTDLGTLGLQGNGFYEAAIADLSGRGALIGTRSDALAVSTGVPVSALRPEFANSYEGAVRFSGGRVTSESSAFIMDLIDGIASRTLILPAGAVGSALGALTIDRQAASGAVFVSQATNPVLVRFNHGAIRAKGIEQSLSVRLTSNVTFDGSGSYIHFADRLTQAPPDLEPGVPAPSAYSALRYQSRGILRSLELYGSFAGKQARLSSLALADRRMGASRSRADIAAYFQNGARVRGLIAEGGDGRFGTSDDLLRATGETLGEVQARVLPANAPATLFYAIPGYATAGVRLVIRSGPRSDLLVDVSNVFDRNYRVVGSGIDGAGRGVHVAYRAHF